MAVLSKRSIQFFIYNLKMEAYDVAVCQINYKWHPVASGGIGSVSLYKLCSSVNITLTRVINCQISHPHSVNFIAASD